MGSSSRTLYPVSTQPGTNDISFILACINSTTVNVRDRLQAAVLAVKVEVPRAVQGVRDAPSAHRHALEDH
jgi:hypothetical protein